MWGSNPAQRTTPLALREPLALLWAPPLALLWVQLLQLQLSRERPSLEKPLALPQVQLLL
jgi:hypothetical protein